MLGGNVKNRIFGILLLIFMHLTILIIPYMLGYYSMGRADDMYYIGEYLQIAKTGYVAEWDIYPMSLILGAIISVIPGIAANQTAFIIPIVFSFIFIYGLILLCRTVSPNQNFLNLSILASFILYLGPYNFLNVPHALFFSFLPLFICLIYRYVKAQTLSNAIILLITTILIPFTHPFIFFFAFIFLLALVFLNPILKRFNDLNFRKLSSPILIMICGFLTWFIYNEVLFTGFRKHYIAYTLRAADSVLEKTADKISLINLDVLEYLRLFLFYYGRYIIPIAIIIMVFVFITIKKDTVTRDMKNKIKFLLIIDLIFILIEGIIFLNPFISHQPDRLTNLNYTVYAQVPLFAYSLYIIFMYKKIGRNATVGLAIVALLLTTTWGLSLYGTFESPITIRPNQALTYNEINGMRWIYESRSDLNLSAPFSQLGRFHALLDDGGNDHFIVINNHFGYNSTQTHFSNTTLKDGERTYVVLTTVDELLYQDVPGYSNIARYTQNDFMMFRYDETVEKLYDGLNLEIHYSERKGTSGI